MIIYIASDGQARLVSPQHVYQGSNVTDITVIAPFPAQTAMTVAFSLPDGKMFGGVQGTMQTPPYLMTPLANQPELPDGVQAWQYVMPRAITQNAGQAKVSVTAQFAQGSEEATSFTQQTSAQVEFTIEPSVVGKLPDEPTEDVWKQVLSYISAQDTKIAAIQSDVADIEQVADEANTNAGAAMDTANEANTTATQAKDTADGLADSIAQANVTASQAEQTAQEAKEIAEGAAQSNGTSVSVGGAFQQTLSFASDPQAQITANKNAIAEAQTDISDIVDGSQTVGKATTADSATNATNAANATKATQDASGNVIDTTYALLPTSVTNTSCASGQWAMGAAAGAGTYLIGTFSVYDSNIHLKISGGIATNTTDAEVFISTANYTVREAVCFANKLYTTSTRTGLYYTIDSSHNLRIFAPIAQYGKLFISAEIAGGTIVGKGDGSIQYPSGGEYIKTNYYFATDPSKLAPSTANGWTEITPTGALPNAGVYLIAIRIQFRPVGGIGGSYFIPTAPAIGVFTPVTASETRGFAILYSGGIRYNVEYKSDGSTKWSMNVELSGGTSDAELDKIYYKRIA